MPELNWEGFPQSNCPLCSGKGHYSFPILSVGSTSMGTRNCSCIDIVTPLQAPQKNCPKCNGVGWKYAARTDADPNKRYLCTCVFTLGLPPREEKPQLTHTDADMDYSHWPGPTMTSFYVDTRTDDKADGKGNWVIVGRTDDTRKQRFNIEALAISQPGGDPRLFTFLITARMVDPPP